MWLSVTCEVVGASCDHTIVFMSSTYTREQGPEAEPVMRGWVGRK